MVHFFDDFPWIALFAAILTVVYSLFIYVWTSSMRKRRDIRKEQSKEFYETLMTGLIEKTITTQEDLINLYKGFSNLSTENLEYRYGLNKLLRKVFANLIGKKINSNLSPDETNAIKDKLSAFIADNEKISPFADLPDTERNMLKDIELFSRENDKDSVERKVKELSGVIQTRYEEQKKLHKQNKLSVPIAVIGIILTIFFGLLSLIFSIQ